MATNSKSHLKHLRRRGDGRWCYDPKHSSPCRVLCEICHKNCNKAYWGKSGKVLRDMERLIGSDD